MRVLSLLSFAVLTACTAADVQTPQPLDTETSAIWSWEASVEDLRAASCPEGQTYLRARSIDIGVIAAERGSKSAREQNLTGMTLAGAWQLKSDEPSFGGLSGLDVLPSGSLLSITDAGAFVWIGIDPEAGAPDGLGSLAYMRAEDGNYYDAKLDADSEGLSFRDGVALVSFERDHRVEAYNLERCGAGARAALVADLGDVVDDQILGSNNGPEALTLSGDALVIGYELYHSGGSPVAAMREDGSTVLQGYTDQPGGYLMTGMDQSGGVTASLFRAYDPIRGPRVILQVEGEGGAIANAHFKQPLPVDNFEGVAIGESPDGKTRIWVIADDNFSRNQRTLLLALDLES